MVAAARAADNSATSTREYEQFVDRKNDTKGSIDPFAAKFDTGPREYLLM